MHNHRTIKQLVEEFTDQRIKLSIDTWKILQHSLYVRVLRPEKHGTLLQLKTYRPAVIIMTNTPF